MSDAPPSGPLTLGIDLGTSAVKVVALSRAGLAVGEAAAAFPTLCTHLHQAEQNPADWLQALETAMRALDTDVTRREGAAWSTRIAAVGLTGQLPTLVCLGADGPVAPAITWRDGRADAWAAARVDAATRLAMYARTGMPLDSRYLAPMVQYHWAERAADLRRILSAKDYLLSVLTGLEMTEPSTAAGYGIYDLKERRFSADLAEFWQIPTRLLPALRPSNSTAGPLGPAGAALLGLSAGTPVSTGAADSVCAAYAMAGLDERAVSISFGSSAVIIGAAATARFDPAARFLLTPHVIDGWYGREMDLLATGTGYRWLSELFGWPDGHIDVEAARSTPGAQGLYFAPYLSGGEQGALWNPRLYGGLLGLSLRHSRADIARAYVEGVCFELRRCVELLAETIPVESVNVSGNLAASTTGRQLLADVLGLPVQAIADRSPAATGAALLARTLDAPGAPQPAAPRLATPPVDPDAATARLYTELYRGYLHRAALCES